MDVKNHDDKAKNEMLDKCRKYYQGHHRMLLDINNFEKDYYPNKSIEWYTKETFVYKLINKALSTRDIKQLYLFRYFIANLSNQLVEEFSKIKEIKMNLYRGTIITKQEAKHFEENIGNIFAVNSYWSTARDREYALTFARKLIDHHDNVRVLFEIKCHLNDSNGSLTFADLSFHSQFGSEQEVLFDIGSVFEIINVRKEKEKDDDIDLYIIEISTTKQGQNIVKTYIDQIHEEMKYESPRIMLGILFKRIGKYEESLEYFKELLKNPGEEKISHIHNRIGIALRLKNDYDTALEHYNIAYDLTSKLGSSEGIYLAFIRHDQGNIHAKNKRTRLALQYYNEAVEIVKEKKGEKNRYIADYYSSFAKLYKYLNNYEEAMKYQKDVLKIREACLPPDHVLHAFSYFGIAEILSCQGKYDEALVNHLKALEIRQKYLLPNHLHTALSLYHLGKIHYKLNQSEKALDYYQKSLEMKRKCLPDSNPYITPVILRDIAVIVYDNNPEEALKYQLEALDIRTNAENVSCSGLSGLLNTIIDTYKKIDRKEDLLNFYEKALQIREKYLHGDKLNLLRTLKGLASVNEEMGEIKWALNYYDKIKNMCTQPSCSHHEFCQESIINIERIKQTYY